MLRNLSTSLFKSEKESVRTTLSKAKELRPFVERLITISKKDTLHARRQVLRHVRDKEALARLFDTLAARYAERPGGYTRILKLGPRRGDNAEMALLELVDATPVATPEPEEPKPSKKKAGKKAEGDDEAAPAEAAAEKKVAKKKTANKRAASKKTTKKKTTKKKAASKKTSEE
jgi:large subunit ribosomal protein L17